MDAEPRRFPRLWPLGTSLALHLAVVVALLLWPAAPTPPGQRSAPIKVSLVPVPPKAPVKAQAVPPMPKPVPVPQPPKAETAPEPKPVARRPVVKAPVRTAARPHPRPTQVAVKPTPTPTPTPDKLTVLRRYPVFRNLPEEQIRQLELPPGLKNWDEFAKLAKDIGLFNAGLPPDAKNVQDVPGSDAGSEPVWSWREDDGEQIGIVAWWGGRATITWKPGDHKASGLIIPEIPHPSPVPYDVPLGTGSDRESVATSVIRILRAFNANGDPAFHPFPEITPAPMESP